MQLGKQYLLGYGVDTASDYESAIYHFVRAAGSGSIEARTHLGAMYLKGYGVRRNVQRAFVLLNESSRAMNPVGLRYLAELYEKGYAEDGFTIEQDHHIALRLAEKACDAGAKKDCKLSDPQVAQLRFDIL